MEKGPVQFGGETKCFWDTEINSWKDFGGYIKKKKQTYPLDEPWATLGRVVPIVHCPRVWHV